MNFLHQLLNRAGNTVHNDVVSPLNRLVNRPGPSPGPMIQPPQNQLQNIQHPLPNDPVGRFVQGARLPIWSREANTNLEPSNPAANSADVRNLANLANTNFQATPAFKTIMQQANPAFNNKLDSGGLRSGQAAGTYSSGYTIGKLPSPTVPAQNIRLDPRTTQNGGFGPFALTHEALHSAFETHPELHQQFANAYNQAVRLDPKMAAYLQHRTGGYAMNNKAQNFSDFNSLNPSMQTEVHSYLSEYPAMSGRQLAQPLANYYSRWIKPNQVNDVGDVQGSIWKAIHPSTRGPLEAPGASGGSY